MLLIYINSNNDLHTLRQLNAINNNYIHAT